MDDARDRPGPEVAAVPPLDHETCFELADRILPGGGLGGYSLPGNLRFAIRRGEGSRIEDLRGRWYVDYACGAGALVPGHAHPAVVAAVQGQAAKGIQLFGTVNEASVRLDAELGEAIPCAARLEIGRENS